MIFVIMGQEHSFQKCVIDYLRVRSFQHKALSKEDGISVLQKMNTGDHWIITGNLNQEVLNYLYQSQDCTFLYLGNSPASDTWEAQCYERAHARFKSSQANVLQDISSFVSQALSSVHRPDWDEYFIQIAQVVARRSNCMKRQVAALIVQDERIIATGYNGTPRGAVNCNEGGCPRCNDLVPSGKDLGECLCSHAEENAIAQSAYHGVSVKDAVLYCTHTPCLHCAKLIVNAGIREVVYHSDYSMNESTLKLFSQCGIDCRAVILPDSK